MGRFELGCLIAAVCQGNTRFEERVRMLKTMVFRTSCSGSILGYVSEMGRLATSATSSPSEVTRPRSKLGNGVSALVLVEMAKHVPTEYSIRQVVETIIIPASKTHQSSLVDIPGVLHSRYSGAPDVLVATSWDGNFHALVKAVVAHSAGKPAQYYYWLDALSVSQHPTLKRCRALGEALPLAAKSASIGLAVLYEDLPGGGALGDSCALFLLWSVVRKHGPKALVVVHASGIEGDSLNNQIKGHAENINIEKAKTHNHDLHVFVLRFIKDSFSNPKTIDQELKSALRDGMAAALHISGEKGQLESINKLLEAVAVPEAQDNSAHGAADLLVPITALLKDATNEGTCKLALSAISKLLTRTSWVQAILRAGLMPVIAYLAVESKWADVRKECRKCFTVLATSSIASPDQVPSSGLGDLVKAVMSSDEATQFQAAMAIRKMSDKGESGDMGKGGYGVMEQLFNAGLIPRLLELMNSELEKLQFEVSSTLRIILRAVQEVPKTSPNEEVMENAIRALGKIAEESVACRDHVHQYNALPALLSTCKDQVKQSILRTLSYALSNMLSGKPAVPFHVTKIALPLLSSLLRCNDDETLSNTCRAISRIAVLRGDSLTGVVESGVFPRLVELLMHHNDKVIVSVLDAVCDIATGPAQHTQLVIDNGALTSLLKLLDSKNTGIKKAACFTISNIAGETTDHVQAVIDAQLLPPLLHLLASGEAEIKLEASWVIISIADLGTADQIQTLVQAGAVKALLDLFLNGYRDIYSNALGTLKAVLERGAGMKSNGEPPLETLLVDAEVLDKLKNCGHLTEEQKKIAVHILEELL
eukprot:gene31980-33906_t